MESLRAMAPRRRRAGQRGGSDHESSATIASSLSADLGADTGDDTFGSQALSILNTLRQKGFSTAESEPVLPRTSRLSASRLVDLSLLDHPDDGPPANGAEDEEPTEELLEEATVSEAPPEADRLDAVSEEPEAASSLEDLPAEEEGAVEADNDDDWQDDADDVDSDAGDGATESAPIVVGGEPLTLVDLGHFSFEEDAPFAASPPTP